MRLLGIGSVCLVLGLSACTKLSFDDLRKKNKESQDQTSVISEQGGETSESPGEIETFDKATVADDCQAAAATPYMIRTLTREEIVSSVERQFQIDLSQVDLASEFPIDSIVKGFRNFASENQISSLRAKLYLGAAEVISRELISQKPEAYTCGQAAEICVRDWVQSNVPAIWRKSLSQEETNELVTFYNDNGANEFSFGLLVTRVLLSPNFLILQKTNQTLTPQEIAGSLSLALWGQGLDQELLSRIQNGDFSEPEKLAGVVRSMIKDPKFDYGLRNFLRSWLETDRIDRTNNNEDTFPGFSTEFKGVLTEEIFLAVRHLIDRDQDTYGNLFSINSVFTTPEVAAQYGYSPTNTGETFRDFSKFQLPEDKGGILSLPGIISGLSTNNNTNIPARGHFVLSKLLCMELPTPSAEILEQSEGLVPDLNLSAQDSLEKMTEGPACKSCHIHINGIGFGMEDSGPIGQKRDLDDHMKPIVASSTYITTTSEEVTYEGVKGLNELLAKSDRGQQCFATQAFRFVFDKLETREESCAIKSIRSGLGDGDLKLTDLLVAYYTSQLFLNRQ